MPLLCLCCAWLVGVYLASVWPTWAGHGWALLPTCAVGAWLLRSRRTGAWPAFVCLAVAGAAALRVGLWAPHPGDPNRAEFYAGQAIQIHGAVSGQPEMWDTRQVLTLDADRALSGESLRNLTGAIDLILPPYPRFHTGQRLVVAGSLTRDVTATSPFPRLVMRYPSVLEVAAAAPSPGAHLNRLRDRARGTIEAILPEPEAGLLAGILLGATDAVPQPVMDAFRETGTSHLIVISGYNLALLCGLLAWLANRRLPRRQAILVALPAIAVYTVFVGAGQAVLRAAIMAGVAGLAVLVGRRNDGWNALMVAAVLITAWQPDALFDIGFRLSFAATAGLMYAGSPLDFVAARALGSAQRFTLARAVVSLGRDALVATVAAQVLTLPLIVHYFGQLSAVMLPANLLVLPAQPALMAAGAAATAAATVWLPAGQALGAIAWLLLTYTIRVVELFASIPWASVGTGPVSEAALLLYYPLAIAGIWAIRQPRPALARAWHAIRRVLSPAVVPAGLLVTALLVWAAVFSLPDGRLHVRFLDVGQGDAALVTTPSGRRIVIDGGPSPAVFLSRLGQAMPFWARVLDVAILSHPDQDHLAGLVELPRRYRVSGIIEPETSRGGPLLDEWRRAQADGRVARFVGTAGLRVEVGDGVVLDVIGPGRHGAGDESLVVRLTYGQVSFLFAGDVDAAGEERLLAGRAVSPCTVLKVAHHGARGSTTPAFLRAARPQAAVISVGPNRFGHPSEETLNRLEPVPVFRTDRSGTVEAVCRPDACDMLESQSPEHLH